MQSRVTEWMAAETAATPLARPARARSARGRPTPVFDELSDGQLVTLALNGRPRAFAFLASRHKTKLRAVVARRVRVREEVEDVVQDTLASAWSALQSYQACYPFEVWLVRIAVNKCRDAGRKQEVRTRSAIYLHELEPAAEADAETVLIEEERQAAVRLLLDGMPATLKEPILLTVMHGASHKEAAASLGLTPKGVEMRVRRGRQWLRERLGADF